MANIKGIIRQNWTAVGGTTGLSWIDFTDGFVPAGGPGGILHEEGLLPVPGGSGSAGSTTRMYLFFETNTSNASYRNLKPTPAAVSTLIASNCSANTSANCTIYNWMTVSGAMDGVNVNAGKNMDIQMNLKRETSTSEEMHTEVEIYHVTSSGTGGTLLDTFVTANITTTYTNYSGTWSVSSSQAFGTGEFLRIKVINYNTGTPP